VLVEAYRAFYAQAPAIEATRRFVRERVRDGATHYVVARHDGRIAGFAQLLPTFDTLRLVRAWVLEDLFVAASTRRLGVASALLCHVEHFARSTGARRISLTTAHDNLAAQALYLANGYALDRVFRTYHRELETRRAEG